MSDIIRRRSSNSTDIRDAALEGVDLSGAKRILDLGCGFGFMAQTLARRVAPDALVCGVDAWQDDEAPFLDRISAAGRTGRFSCMEIGATLPFDSRSFDVVVCCFSLYFFVEVLPEVARVLGPDGLLLAVTHSEQHVAGDLPAAGLGDAAVGLVALVRRFSAENGTDRLRRHFGNVERIDYANALTFRVQHMDELIAYLRFKLPFLVPGARPSDGLPANLEHYVRETMAREGQITVRKNDAILRCRRPRCR